MYALRHDSVSRRDATALPWLLAWAMGLLLPSASRAEPIGFQLLRTRSAEPQGTFFVYRDADDGVNHGFPSGLFADSSGTLGKIALDAACIDDSAAPHGCSADPTRLDRARGTVLRIAFDPLAPGEFIGVNVEEPENWGALPRGRGYDLRGSTHLVLEARSPDGLMVRFGTAGATTAPISLTSTWTEYHFALGPLVSPAALADAHILFTVETNDIMAPAGGTVLIDDVRFEPVPTAERSTPGLPVGTESFGVLPTDSELPGRVPVAVDQVVRNLATTYESAIAAQALLAQPSAENTAAAVQILDSLAYALEHDNAGAPLPIGSDGSRALRNGYSAGPLPLHNDQGPGSGQQGQVRLAGFSASFCGASGFCLVLDGATGGNNAFAILAFLDGFEALGDSDYLEAARTLARWIENRLRDPDPDGFGGYFVGYEDQGKLPKSDFLIRGKSIENNADIFVAFRRLAEIERSLGDTEAAALWTRRAYVAGDFVMDLFDPGSGCFLAGTVPMGTPSGPGITPDGAARGNEVINTFRFLDANTFTTLAMAESPRYRHQIDWRRPAQCMLDQFGREIFADGTTFSGYGLDEDTTTGPDGVAWEFTAQVVPTLRLVDVLYGETRFEAEAVRLLQEMVNARALSPFGDGLGLVAATLEGGSALPPREQCLTTPFQCIPQRVGLAATVWGLFAETGVNPLAPPGVAGCTDLTDGDGDGIADVADNCTRRANGPLAGDAGGQSQRDDDGDGVGNICDCDFDQDGSCGLGDFNIWLPDFVFGTNSGIGSDMDGDGHVSLADFNLFLPGFVAGAPGPAKVCPGS